MIRTELPPADPAPPVRREWRAPELRELSADATSAGFVVVPDGPTSS